MLQLCYGCSTTASQKSKEHFQLHDDDVLRRETRDVHRSLLCCVSFFFSIPPGHIIAFACWQVRPSLKERGNLVLISLGAPCGKKSKNFLYCCLLEDGVRLDNKNGGECYRLHLHTNAHGPLSSSPVRQHCHRHVAAPVGVRCKVNLNCKFPRSDGSVQCSLTLSVRKAQRHHHHHHLFRQFSQNHHPLNW
jgi:hypothetical protein